MLKHITSLMIKYCHILGKGCLIVDTYNHAKEAAFYFMLCVRYIYAAVQADISKVHWWQDPHGGGD